MRKLFTVVGMHCSACSASIERVLNKQKGIITCNVSLLAKRLCIDYDPKIINEDEIKEIVSNTGFSLLPYKPDAYTECNLKDTKHEKNRILISIVLLIPLIFISAFGMRVLKKGLITDFNIPLFSAAQIVCELCLAITIIILNRRYYIDGFKSLIRLSPSMDSLIAIGSAVSLLYGIFQFFVICINFRNIILVKEISMSIYIESSATVLVFVSIGKYIEQKTTRKTTSYIECLMKLTPKISHIVVDNEITDIDTLLITVGDIILVKEGETVPADGVIVFGYGNLDESSLTGETIPVYKSINNEVMAGTINVEGTFHFKVTKVGDQSTISEIAQLIDHATTTKGHLSKIVDSIARYFVPFVIVLAFVVFAIWLILTKNISIALNYGLSTLLISCPCALGLATPIAILVGCSKGAKMGVLFKNAESFENLAKTSLICFDKTGTLTKGNLTVSKFVCFVNDEDNLLQQAACIEANSPHLISKAIVKYAQDKGLQIIPDNRFYAIPGQGVSNDVLWIGNLQLLLSLKIKIDTTRFIDSPYTIIYICNKDKVVGYFVIKDELKDDVITSINALKNTYKLSIISGDSRSSVENLSNLLDINEYRYECTPADKVNYIKTFKDKYIIAFVGDGINDAPSLAESHIAIAFKSGSPLTCDVADVVLMRNELKLLNSAINLSKYVTRNIKENLLWAFLYNIILIPIAAGLFVSFGVSLTPTYAAIAMSLSSICVVLNALRINKKKL